MFNIFQFSTSSQQAEQLLACGCPGLNGAWSCGQTPGYEVSQEKTWMCSYTGRNISWYSN